MDRLIRVCVAIVLACISTSALAETCIASHYGYSGGRTASGERMNPSAMTAAHRGKPFGSQVTVTSQRSDAVSPSASTIAARSSRDACSIFPRAPPANSVSSVRATPPCARHASDAGTRRTHSTWPRKLRHRKGHTQFQKCQRSFLRAQEDAAIQCLRSRTLSRRARSRQNFNGLDERMSMYHAT
jgi:hypothetical protein